MNFKRAIFPLALVQLALSQDCPTGSGNCDFEPLNPVVCGPDKDCGYNTFCEATAAGFDVDADCCQSFQLSACPALFDPQVCGDKACPYDNLCLADLAGYSEDQCTTAPEECGQEAGNCSGEPSNPVKCGTGKTCKYQNFCEAEANGYDVSLDCCQDTRIETACPAIIAPVSCGPPAGKQCPYDSQCLADAAGYNENQCCPAVPDTIACPAIESPPVECGSIPCLYVSQCQASAAGFSESDCCPQVQGACTADNDPVACGENKCPYSSTSCANAAGFTDDQCCKQPSDQSACTAEYAPVACSSVGCIYSNPCVAELAGFDPNSCVVVPQTGSTNGDETTSGSAGRAKSVIASIAVLVSLQALM